MQLLQISPGHALWPATSLFIRSTYVDHYSAHIANLPHKIVALIDTRNQVHCAAGLRDCSEPYFSEAYLDHPIETVIGGIAGRRVERHEIVEVANLASRTPAASARFMRELILYGETLGFNWAFFTATLRLEGLLRRLRLPLIELGTASADRVPDPAAWGTYYDAKPKVLAIGRDDLAPFLARASESEMGARAHG